MVSQGSPSLTQISRLFGTDEELESSPFAGTVFVINESFLAPTSTSAGEAAATEAIK